MGTYRLILAIAVALSHAGVLVAGYNIGVVAVVSFFILSGYVMTALVRRDYASASRVGAFYLDRAGRIYPQFALYLCVALAVAVLAGPAAVSLSLTPATLAANVLLVPLNFYMVGGIGEGTLLPPTWSLGLEATFYLAIPWLLIWRLRAPAFVVSLAVFAAGCIGALNSDLWGYRLLPGTLFMFLLGSYIRDGRRAALALTWLACLATWCMLIALDVDRPRMPDVLCGMTIGIPAVWALTKIRLGRLDDALGNVSYGLFLAHWPTLMAARALGMAPETGPGLALWVAVSAALAWASYNAVERPLVSWRRSLRSRGESHLGRPGQSGLEVHQRGPGVGVDRGSGLVRRVQLDVVGSSVEQHSRADA